MVSLTKSFNLKDDEDMLDLLLLHPYLFYLFGYFNMWCYNRDLPVVITNVVNERIEGVSVSDIHAKGRAIDISIKNWTDKDIEKAIDYFTFTYLEPPSEVYPHGITFKDIGAFRDRPENRTFIYYHKGTSWHLHLQIRPDIIEYLKQQRRKR